MPDGAMSGSNAPDSNPDKARRRSRQRNSPKRKRAPAYAALDLGTNNCRLLIARPSGETFKVVDSYSRVVRLGQGLAASGRLSDESMEATVEAVKVCARKMKAKQVKRWRCVATEACRKAENGPAFMERIKSETGISFDIISPRVEARLAVMGCLNLIDPTKDVALVIDIGGGSTELSWVDVRKFTDAETSHRVHRPPIAAWASLPIGVVTLSEQVPEREDREAWYAEMKDFVRATIKEQGCETRFTKAFEKGKGHLIATSGTVTSLAGIHLKLPFYQRNKVDGLWLRTGDAVAVARRMASLSRSERAKEPCIGEDRATLLVAGCAITDVLCEMWPSKIIRVADRGLREGMLIGLMNMSQKVRTLEAPKDSLNEVTEGNEASEESDHG